MLVRIVKMTFKAENIADFQETFDHSKQKIRDFDGCTFLELYQDQHDAGIFFTYSYWESTAHLNSYRNSALFKGVWAKTKILFAAKPEAWSVDKIASLQ